mmetsp:Transcript_7184/g.21920  ORF Transcript_7184/g.21920 Transcript_7184/m.21920 type:complete len:82 (-) Transcript_7184:2046-2291(-)
MRHRVESYASAWTDRLKLFIAAVNFPIGRIQFVTEITAQISKRGEGGRQQQQPAFLPGDEVKAGGTTRGQPVSNSVPHPSG